MIDDAQIAHQPGGQADNTSLGHKLDEVKTIMDLRAAMYTGSYMQYGAFLSKKGAILAKMRAHGGHVDH